MAHILKENYTFLYLRRHQYGSVFILKSPYGKIKQVILDQPLEDVRHLMRLAKRGQKKYLYFNHKSDEIEMEYIGNDVWQLADTEDVYQFSCGYEDLNHGKKKFHKKENYAGSFIDDELLFN